MTRKCCIFQKQMLYFHRLKYKITCNSVEKEQKMMNTPYNILQNTHEDEIAFT